DRLTVKVGNEALDYFIRLNRARKGKVSGLFGNFDGDPDNDLTSSTGRVLATAPPDPVDATHPLYATFGGSWRVPAGSSLFAAPFAPSADAATFPRRPPAPPAETAVDAAAAKCAAPPLADDAAKRACIFDLSA